MPSCNFDHLKLYYEEYGIKDQVPLIFLHGVMASSQIWIPQVDYFKERKKIIVFDLRGHGRSDKPHKMYSIQQFSNDLHSLMNRFKIEKALEKVLKNPKYVVRSCFSTIQDFDILSKLAYIQAPTLIIHGSQSLNPLKQARYMNELIPYAKLVIIEGGGHALTIEGPKEICEAVEKFI